MDDTQLPAQADQCLAQCQYAESKALFEECIDIESNNLTSYWYLGLTLLLQDRPEEATDVWFSRLLEENPEQQQIISQQLMKLLQQEAHSYHQMGDLKAAEKIYSYLLQEQPHSAFAYYDLGTVLADRGQTNAALQLYQKAIALAPNTPQFYVDSGRCLIEQGNFIEAYNCLSHALRQEPNNLLYRKWFAIALGYLSFNTSSPDVIQEIQKCFAEEEIYKQNLLSSTLSILKLDHHFKRVLDLAKNNQTDLMQDDDCLGKLSTILDNKLLQNLLEKTIIYDLDLEPFSTLLRKKILLDFKSQNIPKSLLKTCSLDFICALAQQSFNNEYIFDVTAEEQEIIDGLQAHLEQLIEESEKSLSLELLQNLEINLAVFSLYQASSILRNSEKVAKIKLTDWTDSVRRLLERTLIHYWQEQELKKSIIALTSIESKISLAVQNQYEANPYPRWLGITLLPAQPLAAILSKDLPYFELPIELFHQTLKVLVAGCGTGGEAVLMATRYKNTDVLGIDISSSSLAYAIRMSQQLNLENIVFRQADLLALGYLEPSFHLISSTGVLHHLENPFEGIKTLVSLLAPSGLMKIGLYSQKARQAIQEARNYIQDRTDTITSKNIKNIRQEILRLAHEEHLEWAREIIALSDFYNLSNCRDLLFHVCEHCFTLPELAQIFQELNLEFLGFHGLSPSLKVAYQAMFPEDMKMNNLSLWDKFEQVHPHTFIAMYKCWLKKQD